MRNLNLREGKLAKKKKSGGRPPRHPGEVLAKNRTFRVRADLERMLQNAAAKSGRSVSETIERVLEDWFFQERLNAGIRVATQPARSCD